MLLKNDKVRKWFRIALRVVERLLAIAGLGFIVYHLGFDLSVIISPSMSPTLRGTSAKNGDWVLSERVTRHWRTPHRWEIVVFNDSEGSQVMKRVVGLPGETVALTRDNQILIDGQSVARPSSVASLKYYPFGNLKSGKPIACGKGYYLLGDDSIDSQDSRFEGPVQPEEITGRAWAIVWPSGHARFVTP